MPFYYPKRIQNKRNNLVIFYYSFTCYFCSNLIYQKGIDRKAQPLERLKKKYAEFESKYRHILTANVNNNITTTTVNKPIEVRGYDSKMIHEGDFSFEEIRAKNWYAKPKISKPSLNDLSKYRLPPKDNNNNDDDLNISSVLPTIQNVENYANVEANRNVRRIHDLTDDIDDEDPGLGIAVNPDDLTHINVFKDNTADLREIAKLVKANKPTDSKLNSNTNTNNNPATPKKKSDWLLKDLLMSFSPIRKKPHLDESENIKSTENSPSKNKSTNLTVDIANVSVSNINSPLKTTKLLESIDLSDIRLLPDSIPDIKTDVTMKLSIPKADYSHLMDPFDLDFKIAQCEAVLAQIASAIPNLHLRLDETAGNKVRAFEKSLGRDGSGPNHTVSSLRMASGHFFMEKKLGEGGYGKVFLAVDLMKDDEMIEDHQTSGDNSVNQVAIKIETPASVWESYIIFRIQSHINNSAQLCNYSRHFPRLISSSIYSDVSFLVIDYYEQGSLLGALNVYRQQNTNLDEAIVLFYASELVKSVIVLHETGILHTDIKLENLLILTPRGSSATSSIEWSSTFKRDGSDGWSERGLVLIDYGRSVDMKLLKDEERSRFFIKSKHQSFNGSPRISQNLDISHEMDWYGVADCLHWLLHQKPLLLHPKSTKLVNSFKRYWQTDIWEPLFDDLLNPPVEINKSIEKFKANLDKICTKLEGWKKTPSLKSLLTRQEIMLYENKK